MTDPDARRAALTVKLLKRVVIAFDADQLEELDEALRMARAHLGLKLVDDADEVLYALWKESEISNG